jgi:hypothetical protein
MRRNVSCTGVAQEVAASVLRPGCGYFFRNYHDIIIQIKKLKLCHVIKTILETIIRFKSQYATTILAHHIHTCDTTQ